MNRLARWIARAFVPCACAIAAVAPSNAETASGRQAENEIGVGVSYLTPGSPLNGGAGPALWYSRVIPLRKKPQAKREAARRPLLLEAEVARITVDRDAGSIAREGEADLTQLSVSVLWPVGPRRGDWEMGVGGGIDYFSPDGKGTFLEPSPLEIRNDYDVDSGVGFHAEFEARADLGKSWRFFVLAKYLIASLDGEHRFVIDGVAGSPTPVDFDLDGPGLALGLARRF